MQHIRGARRPRVVSLDISFVVEEGEDGNQRPSAFHTGCEVPFDLVDHDIRATQA